MVDIIKCAEQYKHRNMKNEHLTQEQNVCTHNHVQKPEALHYMFKRQSKTHTIQLSTGIKSDLEVYARPSCTGGSIIDSVVAVLPDAWRYSVSSRTGRPGVIRLKQG